MIALKITPFVGRRHTDYPPLPYRAYTSFGRGLEMTEHSISLIRSAKVESKTSLSISHPLEQIDTARLARRLVIFQPDAGSIDRLITEAGSRIAGLADASVVKRIARHNPDSIWAFARKAGFDPSNPKGEGFMAILLLTREGLKHLAARTLDATNPDLDLIAKPGERPAGGYVWATYAPGTLAPAVALVLERLSAAPYDGVPLFTRATTKDGYRFTESLGFRKGVCVDGIDAPHLYVYERCRTVASNAPLYDTYRPGAEPNVVSVTVAHDMNDMMRISSIRSAVYIGEQECPYEEEFDGNDFAAAHLLGYVGDQPAGCIRIRHFADFAKIERLAVRREFRNTRLSFVLVKAAIEFCRAKGYRRAYGHAQRRLVPFWSRFGGVPLPGREGFVFSDFDYVEVMVELEPHPDPIVLGSDPYVIIRPEGRWHEPGVLDRSAARPVTRPSVGAAVP
jgi:predicted GNAT family N-acyltransferase